MIKYINSLIILVIFGTLCLNSQERPKYGIQFGYGLNSHNTDLRSIPGVPDCCPDFTKGSGSGLFAGIVGEYPIYNSLYLGMELAFHDLSGELKTTETTQVYYNNQVQTGEFEHRINANIFVFSIMPKIKYRVYSSFFADLGLEFAFPMQSDFSQEEQVVNPQGTATFLDENGNDTKSNKRNQNFGNIKNVASMLGFFKFGISYDFPINAGETLILSPNLHYSLGLNDIVESNNWKVNTFTAKLALCYSPQASKKMVRKIDEKMIIDTISKTKKDINKSEIILGKEILDTKEINIKDTIIVSKIIRRTDTLLISEIKDLAGTIEVFGIDSEGNLTDKPQFITEEFTSSRNQPLLSYIFFDSLSYDIPARYRKMSIPETKKFNVDSLFNNNTLETYYNVLNIIAYRLKQKPNSKLTIKGCNSNIGSEASNLLLSRNRANSVANYLNTIWNISMDRIQIIARNLPETYSFPSSQSEKQQENRRVELYSDDYDILSPIDVNEISMVTTPPMAKFVVNTKSQIGVKQWSINIDKQYQSGVYHLTKSGYGTPPKEIIISLDSIINSNQSSTDNLSYSLKLNDAMSGEFISPQKDIEIERISIEKKRIEKKDDIQFEKFNLILFDFVSNALNQQNQKAIELIKTKISNLSTVKIIGYTDNLGEPDDNKKLSVSRAESVYKSLGIKNAIVDGKGEVPLLYDNTHPEGRFYCRTVEITVETPINH